MILPDPEKIEWDWASVIYGDPASKANSRRHVTNAKTGKPMSIKAPGAIRFANDLRLQVRPLREKLAGPLMIWADLFYMDMRKDLDASLVEDGLQGLIFENDRQLVVKVYRRYVDKASPRAVVKIKRLEP